MNKVQTNVATLAQINTCSVESIGVYSSSLGDSEEDSCSLDEADDGAFTSAVEISEVIIDDLIEAFPISPVQ
ncbi:hypothetical protein T4C_4845 [Trichinella pseudospiralis]|uniref:Uncharacterized protein n=1 Tax=Trichinella pseudospiralis TaxID=6337 RepID=A0A0V1K4Y1_TRIPS|nr:hypothetical protein T4C_4845 [Trichinella pseudospiralis]